MGTSVEFFARPAGQANYLMGSDIFSPPRRLRPVAAGSASFGNPDHFSKRLTDSADNGEVHANSDDRQPRVLSRDRGGTNKDIRPCGAGVGAANREQSIKCSIRGFTLLLRERHVLNRPRRDDSGPGARDLYGAGSAPSAAVTQHGLPWG